MAKGASARAAARKQRDKWKAKRWFTIRAPRTPWSFRVIGETLAEEPSQLIGRNYEVIQNELDGDFSKMHVKVVFKVTDVLGNDAITEFVGHELLKESTWFKLQAATLDGTLENKIKEAVSKIQPVRTVVIRRTQLIQSGVLVEDGPTLDEIHAQEKEQELESKSLEVIGEESDEEVVNEEEIESESSETVEVDYSSLTVSELKELLKAAGKPVSGKKAELIDRLNE